MIESKSALITGARRGIGRAIAEALAREKFAVMIDDVCDQSGAQEAVESCRMLGSPKVVYCQADLSDPGQRNKLVDTVGKEFGRLDMLVNNAGVAPSVRKDILEAEEASFDRLWAINLKGPFFLTQALANAMIGWKKEIADYTPMIVNISSNSAYTSSPSRGEYCITKAGLSMMTKLYADRLAQYGINVYEIRPGIIATDMTSGVKEKYDNLIAGGITPIRRWGQPEDIAKAVVAFAKNLLPFSTGEVINVDGGFHLRRL